MMLPDVIGHENQSQHYQHHRFLDSSGRITTPDRFSHLVGLSRWDYAYLCKCNL